MFIIQVINEWLKQVDLHAYIIQIFHIQGNMITILFLGRNWFISKRRVGIHKDSKINGLLKSLLKIILSTNSEKLNNSSFFCLTHAIILFGFRESPRSQFFVFHQSKKERA